MPDIKAIYDQQFLPARDPDWFASYCNAVERASLADEATFRSYVFQKTLWELSDVTNIGPGNAVTVPGAYSDPEIIDALWRLRNWTPSNDPLARAQYLDGEFERILALVSPRHNPKRPKARLVRIFATLRVHDVLCLMDSRRTVQFRQWLNRPGLNLGLIGQNVLARQALRDVLGSENDIGEAVSYSQFSWFVWDRIISPTEIKVTGTSMPPSERTQEIVTDAPKLALLPARMQRKGMFYLTDNLRLLMSVVRAAENGIETDDLLAQILDEAPNLNQSSRKNVLSQAIALNLLSVERGTYRPTANGRGLLEGDSAADMLTPMFVRSVFGFALILRDLVQAGHLTRGEVTLQAQGYYPNWTTPFAPNALIAWMRDLELVRIDGVGRTAAITLTEAGEYWGSGLPEPLETLAAAPMAPLPDEPSEVNDVPDAAFAPAEIEAVLACCSADPELARFVFSEMQMRLVHAALHSAAGKRFLLLAGLSGTGKTSMARVYARGYCAAKGLPHNAHYLQVAVWPDWTDPSGLLGFVNPLASPPAFHETPALRLLLAATQNPAAPYFLCLDEMNLARVEHYFAPFLSAMEGDSGRLAIHAGENAVDGIPPAIAWPRNLFIIGTVNMDETTHPFSDKVLDRAFTFEFWEADLDAWRDKAAARAPADVLAAVLRVLKALYAALVPARRHFGYRTCDEVLGFCDGGSGVPLVAAMDAAVLAKVLPKIRGESGGALPQALADTAAICTAEGLVQSAAKLVQMQASLTTLGIAHFWS